MARQRFVAGGWDLAEPSGEEALPDDTISKEAVKKIVHRRFCILAVCQHNTYMNTSVRGTSSKLSAGKSEWEEIMRKLQCYKG